MAEIIKQICPLCQKRKIYRDYKYCFKCANDLKNKLIEEGKLAAPFEPVPDRLELSINRRKFLE